eukprot:TRINITY_DN66676_c6_g2_i2.p1 TRINITY_DN66676_c6_g2~~TRINITY_DN66676_c6_g2_i2.p1  ORF type:complete len:464 (-),score=49.15 TRINITY_DN66676_c6_g2_i2:116-1507(-)
MSYRELRKLCETMRSLGYARLISMESWRNPNFELVTDVLVWLVQRHDPSAPILDDITTESDRIAFLTSVADLLAVKFHVKINCKRLYQADGHAAQELLKLATGLQQAMRMTGEEDERDFQADEVRAFDAKAARSLAGELTQDGAHLSDLLSHEIENASVRDKTVARPPDLGKVEATLRPLIKDLQDQTDQMTESLSASLADEESLQGRIESRRTQLERTMKRLRSLEDTRPAHQEEYMTLETELAEQFAVFLEHFRNLEYMEHELKSYKTQEDKALEEQESKLRYLREKLRKQEIDDMRAAEQMESAAVARAREAEHAHRSAAAAAAAHERSAPQPAMGYQGQDHIQERPSRPPSGRRQRQQPAEASRAPAGGGGGGGYYDTYAQQQRDQAAARAAQQQAKIKARAEGTMYGEPDSEDDSEEDEDDDDGELIVGDDRRASAKNLVGQLDDDDDDDDDDDMRRK